LRFSSNETPFGIDLNYLMKDDFDILNASIREKKAIRVGCCRLIMIFLPFAVFTVLQHTCTSAKYDLVIDLFCHMFDLLWTDYLLTFGINAFIGLLGVLYSYILLTNDKSLE